MCHGRTPFCCFVPPHVLRAIAENGDEEQRRAALGTLSQDQSIRMARVQNAKLRDGGPREGADFLAVSASPRVERRIRDAQGQDEVARGPVVRQEGDPPTGDQAVDEAYDGLGRTFDFFLEAYGRDSIDDRGMPLRGVVHYGERFANAFWDGRRMIFGDGDGLILGRMTRSLDVIGHELGHGVTEAEAGLEYWGQSGALNESMSDVFGSLVEQRHRNQNASAADWLIGNEVWTPKIKGDALRSMKAPGKAYDDPLVGKDPQPDHMSRYVQTTDDNGGVHINSGIPNHAFYLAATRIGGFAWEGAGRIWYEALQDPSLKPTSGFRAFARITLRVAERLFGAASGEVTAVREGWSEVGVTPAKK
jgi:Zn-dependent metalloprotease